MAKLTDTDVSWNPETNEVYVMWPDGCALRSTAGEWSFGVGAVRLAEELCDFELIEDRGERSLLIREAGYNLRREFAKEFFGFGPLGPGGEWTAPVWLVGIEHGSAVNYPHGAVLDLDLRVQAWQACGGSALVNLGTYADTYICDQRWLGPSPSPTLQPTYGRLLTVVFEVVGIEPTADLRRWYQGCRLGRSNGEVAIIERSVLPSRTIDEWYLDECVGTREYCQPILSARQKRIEQQMLDDDPPLVITYGGKNFLTGNERTLVKHVPSPTSVLFARMDMKKTCSDIRMELGRMERQQDLDHLKEQLAKRSAELQSASACETSVQGAN